MIKREDLLPLELVREIQAHAREEYPKEACGVVTTNGYLRVENIASDPVNFATWDPEVLQDLLLSKQVVALFHSHTNGMFCPSEQDMRIQLLMDIPFLLAVTNGQSCSAIAAWGDMLEPPPLLERGFQAQIFDCYELVRDHRFLEYGERLPSFPRGWMWWKRGRRLLEEGFSIAGYRELEHDEPRLPGDGILLSIGSDTPNHAAVYLGDDLLLHHPGSMMPHDPMKLSRRDPVSTWISFNPRWLRRDAESLSPRQAG